MSNVEKISVALTPELAALIRQSVESGDYASSSEVMREALRDWKHRQSLKNMQIQEIRELWQEGLDSGPSKIKDFKALRKKARQRLD